MLSYNVAHFEVEKMSPLNVAYHHRGEGTDFHRGLWPMTRPLLHHSHRTPLHCSYPAVPRSPLSWPPDTQTTFFIHTHTRWTLVTGTQHIRTLCQTSSIKKQPFFISTLVHPCYYCTDKTMTQVYSKSLTCKHSIHLIDTYKIHSSRSHEFDFVYQQTLRDKTDVAKINKTYSKKGVAYWKVNAWGCFFSIPWNIIVLEKQT